MRLVKVLFLATVAAVVVVASIGAGSASAATLCTKTPQEVEKNGILLCESGTQLKQANLTGKAKETLKIEMPLGNVECKKGSLEAKVEHKKETAEMVGEVTKSLFEECTSTVLLCTGAATVKSTTPWSTEVLYDQTATPEGRLVFTHPSRAVKLPCGSECQFGGADVEEGDLSNKSQTLSLGKEPLTGPGGGLCSKTATETGTYGMELASGVLVAGEQAVKASVEDVAEAARAKLCLEQAVKGECPAGKSYAGKIEAELSAGNEMLVEDFGGSGAIKCTEAPMKATFSGGGVGSIEAFEYTGCTSTLKEIKAEARFNPPFDNTVLGYYDDTYGLVTVKQSSGEPELELETTGNEPCAYLLTREPWTWNWFSASAWHFFAWKKLAGPSQCPKTLVEEGFTGVRTTGGTFLHLAEK